jgi:hypothetical protein
MPCKPHGYWLAEHVLLDQFKLKWLAETQAIYV